MSDVQRDLVVIVPPLNEEKERQVQIVRDQGAIRLLRSCREDEDEQEQKETWEYVRRALDKDRLPDRKLFSDVEE